MKTRGMSIVWATIFVGCASHNGDFSGSAQTRGVDNARVEEQKATHAQSDEDPGTRDHAGNQDIETEEAEPDHAIQEQETSEVDHPYQNPLLPELKIPPTPCKIYSQERTALSGQLPFTLDFNNKASFVEVQLAVPKDNGTTVVETRHSFRQLIPKTGYWWIGTAPGSTPWYYQFVTDVTPGPLVIYYADAAISPWVCRGDNLALLKQHPALGPRFRVNLHWDHSFVGGSSNEYASMIKILFDYVDDQRHYFAGYSLSHRKLVIGEKRINGIVWHAETSAPLAGRGVLTLVRDGNGIKVAQGDVQVTHTLPRLSQDPQIVGIGMETWAEKTSMMSFSRFEIQQQ